jgi:glycosyltransferase involved in cell wall biosynthesis
MHRPELLLPTNCRAAEVYHEATAAREPLAAVTIPDRISVIIPAYNAARFIAQTIRATLGQTYQDVEIIVVDDGSSDGTADIARGFGERVTFVRHERKRGVSTARNSGAARATGAWLAFLDADDWWPPAFLEEAAPLLEQGRALCYDNVLVEDPPGLAPAAHPDQMLPTLHRRALRWDQHIVDRSNLALMFDGAPLLKSIIHQVDFTAAGGFDARFTGGEDFHFHIKLLANGVRLLLVDHPHGFYRVHASQTTAAISGRKERDPVRHLESCREWIRMFEAMPRELNLDAASVQACRIGRRYWRYRFARAAVLIALRSGKWRFIRDRDFLRSTFAAMPLLSRRAITRLSGKSQ